jgi:hypothetical protein
MDIILYLGAGLAVLIVVYLIKTFAFKEGFDEGRNQGVQEGMFQALKHMADEEKHNNRS